METLAFVVRCLLLAGFLVQARAVAGFSKTMSGLFVKLPVCDLQDGRLQIPEGITKIWVYVGAGDFADLAFGDNAAIIPDDVFVLVFEPALEKYSALLTRCAQNRLPTLWGRCHDRAIIFPFAIARRNAGMVDFKMGSPADANDVASKPASSEQRRVPAIEFEAMLGMLLPPGHALHLELLKLDLVGFGHQLVEHVDAYLKFFSLVHVDVHSDACGGLHKQASLCNITYQWMNRRGFSCNNFLASEICDFGHDQTLSGPGYVHSDCHRITLVFKKSAASNLTIRQNQGHQTLEVSPNAVWASNNTLYSWLQVLSLKGGKLEIATKVNRIWIDIGSSVAGDLVHCNRQGQLPDDVFVLALEPSLARYGALLAKTSFATSRFGRVGHHHPQAVLLPVEFSGIALHNFMLRFSKYCRQTQLIGSSCSEARKEQAQRGPGIDALELLQSLLPDKRQYHVDQIKINRAEKFYVMRCSFVLGRTGFTPGNLVPIPFYMYTDAALIDAPLMSNCSGPQGGEAVGRAAVPNDLRYSHESGVIHEFSSSKYFVRLMMSHPWRVLDPRKAEIFIVPIDLEPIPLHTSSPCALESYQMHLWEALRTLVDYPTFQAKSGADHLWLLGQGFPERIVHKYAKDLAKVIQDSHLFSKIIVGAIEIFPMRVAKAVPEDARLDYYKFVGKRPHARGWRCTIPVPFIQSFALGAPPILDRSFHTWLNRSYTFYHQISGWYQDDSSKRLRKQALNVPKVASAPDRVWVGDTYVSSEDLLRGFQSSRFCFAIAGRNGGPTRKFYDAVAHGCIPVVVCDIWLFNFAPFSSFLEHETYAIFIPEERWMSDLAGVIAELENMDVEVLRRRHQALLNNVPFLTYDGEHSHALGSVMIYEAFHKCGTSLGHPNDDKVYPLDQRLYRMRPSLVLNGSSVAEQLFSS